MHAVGQWRLHVSGQPGAMVPALAVWMALGGPWPQLCGAGYLLEFDGGFFKVGLDIHFLAVDQHQVGNVGSVGVPS